MKRSIILVVFVLQAARAVPFVAAADVWQQESYLEEMTTERQSGMRGNMLKKSGWMFGIMLAVAAVLSASSGRADDILIADFEQKTYGDWKVEGEAFGKGPAKGTIGSQQTVSGFEGKGLVNTFLGGATEGRKQGAAWLWKSMDLENWIGTFDRGAAIRCGLIVRASDRAEGTKVWVGADNTFGIGGCRNTHFLKRDDPAVLHIFVDRGVLEIYCDGVAVTHKCFAPADRIEVFAFSEGGEATMIGLDAWKMKAMWE